MCNLDNVTTNVEALVQLAQTLDRPNLPELGSVYPNYEAPVFRPAAGAGVELTMLEWGGAAGQRPEAQACSNVRNTASRTSNLLPADEHRRPRLPTQLTISAHLVV